MFIIDQLYPRDALMRFVGSKQGQVGIIYSKGVSPLDQDYVILTSGGRHGKRVGYSDQKNPDGSWAYYGQGSKGDQSPDSAGNKMLLSQASKKLLFSTREPTAGEVKRRGHHSKLYRFEGVYEIREWSFEKIESGLRAGDTLIKTILAPLDEIPRIAESLDKRDISNAQNSGSNTNEPFSERRQMIVQNYSLSDYAGDDAADARWMDNLTESLAMSGEFAVDKLDARIKTLCEIAVRRGQPAFRRVLLIAYGGRCAMTGYNSEEALEAAHITPYLGNKSQDVRNGLLLRADLHTLFDRGLISIDPESFSIHLSNSLENSSYKKLQGRKLNLPSDTRYCPHKEALRLHRAWALDK